jgi:hypothetical protein
MVYVKMLNSMNAPIRGFVETNLGLYELDAPLQCIIDKVEGTMTLRFPTLHIRRRVVVKTSFFTYQDMLLKKQEHQIECRRGDKFNLSFTLGVAWL